MIGVTERAKQELKGLLTKDTPVSEEICVRLRTDSEGKLGLGFDIEKPDDETLECDGKKLLVVESALAGKLENTAIDIVDSKEGKKFVIVELPQAK